ncbi:MAG: UDP-glucose 4-epimerase GalE [Candidatus Limnocylindrus sp.]
MSVLVTGGAGYIGSHMVLALAERGEEVVVLDNLSTGVRGAVAAEARFIEGDVGDGALLDRLMAEHRFDAVIHFAGSIVVPDSVSDPLVYYLNNTSNARTLIASAVKAGIPRFIFSSTAAVYGNPQSLPILEDAPTAPISPYGSSKLMTEWMLRDAHAAYGLDYIALRYFNVAGADPERRVGQMSPRATHLVKVACQAALGLRPTLEVFGTDYPTADGTCLRDYIHVSDLVAAHLDALSYLRDGGASAVLNCGYGRGYSVLEVIAAVERAIGGALPVTLAPRRDGDPAAIIAGAERAKRLRGWQPRFDAIDVIVKTALDWERKLQRRDAA